MKLTKNELKLIVKECLLEILSEGIGSRPILSGPRQDLSISQKVQERQTKSYASNVKDAMKETIKKNAGGDKILESILADTASNTLPKFLSVGEGKGPVHQPPMGLVEQIVSEKSPEDIFGDEITSKWADLAFTKGPRGNK